MGMAVLLGKNIYNIAELLEKEVLKALHGNETFEWLYHMLQILDSGDINGYDELSKKMDASNPNQQVVIKNHEQLYMKVRILAFLDLIFRKEKGDRNLTFEQIADATQLQANEAEFLIMKAMSNGLVRGIIDEVDQVVRIEWVQPRYLSQEKIKVLSDKLNNWQISAAETVKQWE